jgi:branched-subunit amino acid transport protein
VSVWVAVVGAGLVTHLIRVLPGELLAGRETPAWLDRMGTWIGAVAFAAIGTAAVASGLPRHGVAWLPETLALVMTGALAALTRRSWLAVAAGLATMWATTGLLALA